MKAKIDALQSNVENIKVGSSLGNSGRDMVEFNIIQDKSRPTSRITALDFCRANFVLFRDMLAEIP